jgi:hypothetical protein
MINLNQDVKEIWDELFKKLDNEEELTKEQKCIMVLGLQNKWLIEQINKFNDFLSKLESNDKEQIKLLTELRNQLDLDIKENRNLIKTIEKFSEEDVE